MLSLVMSNEEAYENNPIVYFNSGNNRRSVCLADSRRNENIHEYDCTAAPFSAAAPVPHRMEHSIRLDGIWKRQNLDVRPLIGSNPRTGSIRLPTGFQFFLESDLFQHPGFRLFLFLVADFVGAGTANDPGLSQN